MQAYKSINNTILHSVRVWCVLISITLSEGAAPGNTHSNEANFIELRQRCPNRRMPKGSSIFCPCYAWVSVQTLKCNVWNPTGWKAG